MKTHLHSKLILSLWVGLILLGAGLSGFAQNSSVDNTTSDEVMKIAKATVNAYENQDWEGLQSHLAPDATIFGLASFDSLDVQETIDYWAKGSETAIPSLGEETWLGVTISEGPKKGNWVYTWGMNTLKYPSGATITFPYHLALKIAGNKIKEAHFYYDNMKIIREMGYAISPPLEDDNLESLEGLNINE